MFGWRNQVRRVVAALLLLPVLVLASSFAHDWMRCRITGAVVPTCACPGDGAEGVAPLATVADPGCCERQSVGAIAVAREPANDSETAVLRPVARAAAPAFVPPALDLPRTVRFAAACRPPGLPGGVSLVLLKRAYLI